MYIDLFVPHLVAEERIKDAIRRNKQARLIEIARGSKESRPRWLIILTRRNALALFNRPQHKQLTANIPN